MDDDGKLIDFPYYPYSDPIDNLRANPERLIKTKKANASKKRKAKSNVDTETNVSPPIDHQNIRKVILYNQKPHQTIIKDFFKELIPDWLFDDAVKWNEIETMDLGYYMDETIPNENFCWCPIKFKSGNPEQYSIYYTIVNRIDYLEKLTKTFKNEVPILVKKSLRAMQDYYQILTLHMELKCQYTNQELISISTSSSSLPLRPLKKENILDEISIDINSNNNNNRVDGENEYLLSPIEMYEPSSRMIFVLTELPDLFNEIIYCEYWGDPIESPFTDPQINKIIDLLSKALPYPCKGRSITSILPNSWTEDKTKKKETYPAILNVIIRLIMCSLLGCYDHCTVIANFSFRRKVYKWFCLNKPSPETVSKWISKNKHLIIYIMREYLFFCIESVSGLNKVMEENYYWNYLRSNTINAMDEVRRRANKDANRYKSCHARIHPDFKVSMFDQYVEDRNCLDNVHDILRDIFGEAINPDEADMEATNLTMDDLFPDKKDVYDGFVYRKNVDVWKKGEPLFGWANSLLSVANKLNLDKCHRPMEESFLDNIYGEIVSINDSNFAKRKMISDGIEVEKFKKKNIKKMTKKKRISKKRKLADANRNELENGVNSKKGEESHLLSPPPPKIFTKYIDTLIQDVIVRLPLDNLQGYEWLMELPICLSFESFYRLSSAELLYDRETRRSVVSKAMTYINDHNPYDYAVLSSYYLALKKHTTLKVFNLPLDITQRQIRALHRLTETQEGDDLPESCGIYYVCTNCCNLKSSVFPYNSEWQKNRKSSVCSEGVCIDLVTGKFTCAKISAKKNPKKRNTINDNNIKDSNESYTDKNKEAKKIAKHKRKNEILRKCPQTELHRFNAIGKILQTDEFQAVLCPECATITTYSRNNFKGSGSFSCGCVSIDKDIKKRCCICDIEVENPIYRMMFDDLSPTNKTLKNMPLCDAHKRNWINTTNTFYRLSFVKEIIKNNLFAIRLKNGDLVFKTITNGADNTLKKTKLWQQGKDAEELKRKEENEQNM